MGKAKPRHKLVTHSLFTKEVVDKVCEILKSGEPLFTKEQYQTNEPRILKLKTGDFELKPANYRYYMRARLKVPETNITFYQRVREARHARAMYEHENQKKELIAHAKRIMHELHKLPLGTKTIRRNKKKGYNEKDGNYYESSKEELETPINPAIVAQKRQGAQFVLERLDADYNPKETRNNVNVMVSLADLRKAKEERDEAKQAKQTGDNSYET